MLVQSLPTQFNSSTLEITDAIPPDLVCRGDTMINSNATIVNNIGLVSSSDNCGVATVTYTLMDDMGMVIGSGMDDASGNTFNVGTTTVTYTVTDDNGQTNSCSFDVIIDNTGLSDLLEFIPIVNFDCDNNSVSVDVIVVNFTEMVGMQFGIRWDTLNLTLNPPPVNNLPEVSNMNTNLENGAILLTWAHFSSNPSSTTLPDSFVIFTLNFDLVGSLSLPILSFEDFNQAIPILMGSESQNPMQQGVHFEFLPEQINIIDTTDPTFPAGCPTDVTIGNDPGLCTGTTDLAVPTATDNCTGIDSITYTINGTTSLVPNGATSVNFTFPAGTTTVTYTAYDGGGNSTTCTVDVTVNSTLSPVVTCPADIMATNDPGRCSALLDISEPAV